MSVDPGIETGLFAIAHFQAAADVIAELIAALKQPATLRAVGVKREQLPKIAEAAMNNIWVRNNPQPIRSPEDVMQILEAAW